MFRDKVVLITGASRGIGKAIAIEFAKQEAIVLINFRSNKKEAEKTLKKVLEFTMQAFLYEADISDEFLVNQMMNAILNRFGRVDFLINNAGIGLDKLFLTSSSKDWYSVFNTNLFGTMHCCHSILKSMIKNHNARPARRRSAPPR